eukprot:5814497-Amphidinium_carterae.1
MTKYLETTKIKKHSETIGLHPYIGNKSTINDQYVLEEATLQNRELRRHSQGNDSLQWNKITSSKQRTLRTRQR